MPGSFDADQLAQAFVNILSNGVSHAATQPVRVKVASQRRSPTEGPHALVSIWNDAHIEPEVLPKIFTPYFTTRKKGDKKHGFGLGMPIAQRMVHAHGGTISVHSAPGEGTTFVVRLPLEGEE